MPQGNFNAPKIVETYFPDISKSLQQNGVMLLTGLDAQKEGPEINASNLEIAMPPPHHKKSTKPVKKQLVTDAEAEQILLRTFFNIGKND
jgi:hypothetical protein